MKLAVMQPYFFPYLGYFQLIHAVDRFILYDNLNYITRGWVNRNRLLVNREPRFIGVPVKHASSFSKIREVEVDSDARWRKHLLRLVYYSYKRAPFFDEVFPLIETVINTEEGLLSHINRSAVKLVAELLEIHATIVADVSNYEWLERELADENSETNLHYARTQGLSDTKTIRVLAICRSEGADTFVNAIGGRSLYEKETFTRNGLDLRFLSTLPYSYRQNTAEFVPNLSIIDVLMYCGKVGTRQLLDRCELV